MSITPKLLQQGSAGTGGDYVEDVFKTATYVGNGASQVISTGLDLTTDHTFLQGLTLDEKGGMIWIKGRSSGTHNHHILTNEWGAFGGGVSLPTNLNIAGWYSLGDGLTFDANGFTLSANNQINQNAIPYTSWNFKKKKKFFSSVIYGGIGSPAYLPHNLDAPPGMVLIKSMTSNTPWTAYHKSLGATQYIPLNSHTSASTDSTMWFDVEPDADNVVIGTHANVNSASDIYQALFFADDAGGFGETGTESIIKCGSYTGTGNSSVGVTVNLGWEPQWLLIKSASYSDSTATTGTHWTIIDNERGIQGGQGYSDAYLGPNLNNQESTTSIAQLLSNGFRIQSTSNRFNHTSTTYIYMAIRRGPMKEPTSASNVFSVFTRTGNGTYDRQLLSFNPDMVMAKANNQNSSFAIHDNLRGRYNVAHGTNAAMLSTDVEDAQVDAAATGGFYGFCYSDPTTNYQMSTPKGITFCDDSSTSRVNNNGVKYTYYAFKRSPRFFDMVNYRANGGAAYNVISHALKTEPEMIILKAHNTASTPWIVWHKGLGDATRQMRLSSNTASSYNVLTFANDWTPNADSFSLYGTLANSLNYQYIGYLFASAPGISKVGSYTGTGTEQQINCGFATGARFVMIKRENDVGDWYVWDSVNGISSGNDPFFVINRPVPANTTTNYVDTYAPGFKINSSAPDELNASGGNFIYLAIA